MTTEICDSDVAPFSCDREISHYCIRKVLSYGQKGRIFFWQPHGHAQVACDANIANEHFLIQELLPHAVLVSKAAEEEEIGFAG